jgi:hypothetical protein
VNTRRYVLCEERKDEEKAARAARINVKLMVGPSLSAPVHFRDQRNR